MNVDAWSRGRSFLIWRLASKNGKPCAVADGAAALAQHEVRTRRHCCSRMKSLIDIGAVRVTGWCAEILAAAVSMVRLSDDGRW